MVTIVSRSIAEEVIKNRMPFGNFIEVDSNTINAINNESGDAEVRSFETLEGAIGWLSK